MASMSRLAPPSPSAMARRAAPARLAPRAMAAALPPRVVTAPLPKLYVYDHCPFCVRVRLALGLKNIKHELIFMANDDVETPTKLVGKKVAPILEIPGQVTMGESLDIVQYFDERPQYGPTGAIKPKSDRDDIKAWQKKVQTLLRLLHRPRYMLSPGMPEFQQRDSRDYFVAGHQLPPYEKADWKANLSIEKKWELYKEAYEQSATLVPELNAALVELESLIYSEECCTPGGLSMDDIDLWARLRSVTLVRGAQFGPKTMAYLKCLESMGDIPLYDKMAI